MKKKLRMLFLIWGMLVLTPMTARADTVKGKDGWAVVFTSGGKMRSNFSDADLNSVMAGMQPGDTGTITLTQRNENAADTDWYMKNEVLNALEKSTKDAAAVGAKYTYKLVYTGPGGTQRELYNSDKVGGDGTSGAGQGSGYPCRSPDAVCGRAGRFRRRKAAYRPYRRRVGAGSADYRIICKRTGPVDPCRAEMDKAG